MYKLRAVWLGRNEGKKIEDPFGMNENWEDEK
jgi:hypothetical protein